MPRRLAIVAVLAACFGCDQASKRVAVSLLPEGHRVSLLGGVVRLELVHNAGAFLGLGAGLSQQTRVLLFMWGTGALILAALAVALRRRVSAAAAMGAALVAGGGLGNLWDRAMGHGLVTDFLNLGLGPLRTGIFNAADVAIVAGALVLAWRGDGAIHPLASKRPRV